MDASGVGSVRRDQRDTQYADGKLRGEKDLGLAASGRGTGVLLSFSFFERERVCIRDGEVAFEFFLF